MTANPMSALLAAAFIVLWLCACLWALYRIQRLLENFAIPPPPPQ